MKQRRRKKNSRQIAKKKDRSQSLVKCTQQAVEWDLQSKSTLSFSGCDRPSQQKELSGELLVGVAAEAEPRSSIASGEVMHGQEGYHHDELEEVEAKGSRPVGAPGVAERGFEISSVSHSGRSAGSRTTVRWIEREPALRQDR